MQASTSQNMDKVVRGFNHSQVFIDFRSRCGDVGPLSQMIVPVGD